MERSDTISCNQGKCCTWHWHQYQTVSRESEGGGSCRATGKSRYHNDIFRLFPMPRWWTAALGTKFESISQIEMNFTMLYFTCRERRSSDSVLSKLWIIVILLAWYLGSFAALFLRVHFSSAKCQSQNQCIPPPHSLVWQRNLIELETFCGTNIAHHFYCTQSPGVGSSNSTVETHLFWAYAKNTTLFLIHNIWT